MGHKTLIRSHFFPASYLGERNATTQSPRGIWGLCKASPLAHYTPFMQSHFYMGVPSSLYLSGRQFPLRLWCSNLKVPCHIKLLLSTFTKYSLIKLFLSQEHWHYSQMDKKNYHPFLFSQWPL